MFTKRRIAVVVIVAAVALPGVAAANRPNTERTGSAEFADGQVLVGLKSGKRTVIRVADDRIEETAAAARRLPDVAYAEPNYIVRATVVPDDTRFDELHGMAQIHATEAWDVGTGDGSVVVGVLDSGISATHKDLEANVWRNPGGIFGCAAGTFGYDVINTDCNPTDDRDHGSHVSGTIGATGNNDRGVVGVNWKVQLLAIKVLDDDGGGMVSQVVEGVDRAIAAKQAGVNLRVLNASFGARMISDAMRDAIARAEAAGILFVSAAGNDAHDNDETGYSPCDYASVCVAALDRTGGRAWWSNYGSTMVDIAAPGVDILSTIPGNRYDDWNGTSMAAPHVTGAIALLAQTGSCRTMAGPQLVAVLRNTADTTPGLGIAGNRTLNLARAMRTCGDPGDPGDPSPPTELKVTDLSGATGSQRFFEMTVPAGRRRAVFTLKRAGRAGGNADLFVGFGARPSTTAYVCSSTKTNNGERCVIKAPAPGVYHVLISGTQAYERVTLRAFSSG